MKTQYCLLFAFSIYPVYLFICITYVYALRTRRCLCLCLRTFFHVVSQIRIKCAWCVCVCEILVTTHAMVAVKANSSIHPCAHTHYIHLYYVKDYNIILLIHTRTSHLLRIICVCWMCAWVQRGYTFPTNTSEFDANWMVMRNLIFDERNTLLILLCMTINHHHRPPFFPPIKSKRLNAIASMNSLNDEVHNKSFDF